MPLPENFKEIVKNAWETIDKYKKYPIANRGLSCYFSDSIPPAIEKFRKEKIKNASILELINNIPEVFAHLKLSAELIAPSNQPFLYACIASALGNITRYEHSQNKAEIENLPKELIKYAESFTLWGSGTCQHSASLLFLLLASSPIRPLSLVSLDSPSGKSGHVLVLIGNNELDIENFYDSETIVVDYWAGCMGKAQELFNKEDALASFKNRKITLHAHLSEEKSIPSFIFPKACDIVGLSNF